MEAGTEPPPSAAAAPPGLPRGAGCGHFSPRRRPWPPPPRASRAPERRVPGPGRDPGAPAARTPPASRGGPPRACPCRGRRRGGTKRGRWRANPEPPGPRPASRPRPRPQRASGTHARTQKVKSGASPARRRRRPTPAPRPHRGPACAARALPPRSHPGPRPPRRPSPRRRPCQPRHLHTHPRHFPGPASPCPAPNPCSSRRTPPGKKAPAAAALAGPGFPRRPGSRLPGLRRATPRGPEPGPATNRCFPAWCSPLGRRRGLQPPPASRSGARLPSSLARRPSASFLSRGLRVFPPSPPPHPPPKSRVPGSAAPRGCASRAPHARAAVPAHNNSPPGRRAAPPSCAHQGQRPGWGRSTPRPPPAGPQGRRSYQWGRHAVRCRLPSALTFAAAAGAQAAAAMFPC